MAADLVPQVAALPSVSGTKLEFFIQVFEKGKFQDDVRTFVRRHAVDFQVVCPDGSYPLIWTEFHKEYRQMFERQIDAAVWLSDLRNEEFMESCRRMHEASKGLPDAAELPDIMPDDPQMQDPKIETRPIRAGEFRKFFDALSASEDFYHFLRVMFDDVIRWRQECCSAAGTVPDPAAVAPQQAAPSPQAMPEQQPTQEIEVAVPDGVGPGQLMTVEFLGLRYELAVPEGCLPGHTFRVTVSLPTPSVA